jgi:hypothetical protein
MYAPPPDGYARTVCRYEVITMTITTDTATVIGTTRCLVARLADSRTTMISPVAYATEDRASEANTGSASTFGRSVYSNRLLVNALPTTTRLRMLPPRTGVCTSAIGIGCYPGGAWSGGGADGSAIQRYPTPGSVRISLGAVASSPSLRRRARTYTRRY